MSMWEKDILLEALRHPILNVEVGNKTRQLVFDQYGILPETQVKIEKMLDEKNDLLPINTELLFWPKDWVDYHLNYSVPALKHGQICADLMPHGDDVIPNELDFDWELVPKFVKWAPGQPWRRQ